MAKQGFVCQRVSKKLSWPGVVFRDQVSDFRRFCQRFQVTRSWGWRRILAASAAQPECGCNWAVVRHIDSEE